MRQGLTWGELILTLLGILLFAGVGFIPGLTGSVFYNQFWFSWLCFAAFVGMTPLLALRTRRPGVLWHIGTAMYVLFCIGLCFHDQDFFAGGGVGNLIWSAPAIVGLFLAESANKRFPADVRVFAIPITLFTLTVSVFWALASPCQIFIPVLFMPKESLQSGHRLFLEIFGTGALLSFGACLMVSTIARWAQQARAGSHTAASWHLRLWRVFNTAIRFKTKFWLVAGLIVFLLVSFSVAFFIPGTCSGSGEFRLPDFRDIGHADPQKMISADDVVAYLRSMGCVEKRPAVLESPAAGHGREPVASLVFRLSKNQSLRLVVYRPLEGPCRAIVFYEYRKVSGYDAWRARGKIEQLKNASHNLAEGTKPIPQEPEKSKATGDTGLSIREVLETIKVDLQVHPEYLPALASTLYKDPSARKLCAVLGFYHGDWSPKQRDKINFIITRIIYGLPVSEILKNLDAIERSQSAEAQHAALNKIADSHPNPPPLAIYVYFLRNSKDVSVQYGAMYALSESNLKDAPRLPDYSRFLEDPAPVVADWEDYLSAHLIAGLQSIKHQNPDDLYALELVCNRRSIQIGEKTQISLFIRGTTRPSVVEYALYQAHQPSEWGSKVPFATNTEYEAKTAGIKTIGPFEIDFQGKHLKSNSVTVEVTDNWPPDEERQEVRVFPRKVIVGTPITVIYRQQYSTPSTLPSEQKETMPLDSKQWLPRGETTWEKDGKLFHKKEWWFELPTTKAGKMTITKADLPGLPSGALVEPAEIEVVEVVIPEERIPKFCDIGAAVNKQNGNCVITELFGGSSASAAGLKEGDIITHIDTKDVSTLDVHQIRALLRGQQNTIVVLTIQRSGETTPKNFTVARRLVNAERK